MGRIRPYLGSFYAYNYYAPMEEEHGASRGRFGAVAQDGYDPFMTFDSCKACSRRQPSRLQTSQKRGGSEMRFRLQPQGQFRRFEKVSGMPNPSTNRPVNSSNVRFLQFSSTRFCLLLVTLRLCSLLSTSGPKCLDSRFSFARFLSAGDGGEGVKVEPPVLPTINGNGRLVVGPWHAQLRQAPQWPPQPRFEPRHRASVGGDGAFTYIVPRRLRMAEN